MTESDLIEEHPEEDDENFWNHLKLLLNLEFETFDSYVNIDSDFICHENLSDQ